MIAIGTDALAVEASTEALLAALALSAATGSGFVWEGFRRRGRGTSGLSRFEAEAVGAFALLAGADPGDVEPGATRVRLQPGLTASAPSELSVDLASGDCLLPLLRALALPLARRGTEVTVRVSGSTHAPGGDTFEVFDETWLQLPRRLGVHVQAGLVCAGFAPKRGGEVVLLVTGGAGAGWDGIELMRREEAASIEIFSAGARVPAHVQQRQAARARSSVSILGIEPTVQLVKLRARNAGSLVTVTGRFGTWRAGFSAVSGRGRSSESVGEEAAVRFRRYANQGAYAPEALVASWIPWLALARGESALSIERLAPEAEAVAAICEAFTGRPIAIEGRAGARAVLRTGLAEPGSIHS